MVAILENGVVVNVIVANMKFAKNVFGSPLAGVWSTRRHNWPARRRRLYMPP